MLSSHSRQTSTFAVGAAVQAGSAIEAVSLASRTPLRVADAVDALREAEVAIALVRCKTKQRYYTTLNITKPSSTYLIL